MRIEQGQKRVRAFLGGQPVVDTTRPLLVWEKPYYPAYFLPVDDVRTDLLPEGTIRTVAEAPEHVALDWDAVDAWFEEDEEIYVHPRSPYSRIDILPSSRSVRVEIEGVVLAESTRAMVLHETGLPPRWYVPKFDVRMDLLTATPTRTACPYKGFAEYWSARVGDRVVEDVAWSYRTPLPESERIAGLVCFYNERVDLFVDGAATGRPTTPFS